MFLETDSFHVSIRLTDSANIAIAEEVSLMREVLPVGGIKGKIITLSLELCVNCVFLPKENRADFTSALDVHFASNYEDVYRIAYTQTQYSA